MKLPGLTLLLGVFALSLAACKDEDETAAGPQAQNPLLSYVPADTPYLVANLEATPAEVVDAYLARLRPTFEVMQAMLDDLQVEVNPDGSGELAEASLVAALLNEVDGKLDRAGIESLGLSLESHKAFYGLGSFPVMRLTLKDPALFRAAIGRIEAEAGIPIPTAQSGGIEYWRLVEGSQTVGLYAAIVDTHLAVGAFPPAAEAEVLPEFLGLAEPAQVFDANQALATLNQDNGFLQYGSGYVDMRRLADELLLPESRTRRGLAASGRIQLPALAPGCKQEIDGLLEKAPRMVFGTTELTADRIGIRYLLEVEESLAGQLMGLVSDVPAVNDETDDMIALSLGLQLGRLREFLLEKVSAAASDPFQCPQLQGFNQLTREALAQLNRPMPPFVGNLNGFRIRLERIDLANPSPQNVRGMAVLEVEKPQMLVGSAQMFVPGLQSLQIEPGGDPVALPEELLRVSADDLHVLAAMSDDALGISLGKDQQDKLADYLEADADNEGTFFSVSYDMAAQMELQNHMRERMVGQAFDRRGEAANEAETAEQRQVLELVRELEQSYQQMLGRASLEVRFVPEGLEVDNRMTFD